MSFVGALWSVCYPHSRGIALLPQHLGVDSKALEAYHVLEQNRDVDDCRSEDFGSLAFLSTFDASNEMLGGNFAS